MHACQLCNTNTQSDMKQLRVADNILRCIIKNVTVRQHQVTPPILSRRLGSKQLTRVDGAMCTSVQHI